MVVGNVGELEFANPESVSVGDTVYFVMSVGGDVIETELVEYIEGNSPRIVTKWGSSHVFTIALGPNTITFDNGTKEAKAKYKNWWKVWGDQRDALIVAHRDKRKRQ